MGFQFVAKPVAIEAVQNTADVRIHLTSPDLPEWFTALTAGGQIVPEADSVLMLHGPELSRAVADGDWIMRGVENDIVPVRASVFDARYEAVEA